MIWRFTLHLKGIDSFTDEQVDALYGGGCSDGTLSSSAGRTRIGFDREGGVAMLGGSNQKRRATASESSEKQWQMGNDIAKNTASPRTPKQWHAQHN